MLYFLYFFIAHFTGDFLFQTNTIVKWKQKSKWGIFLHVLIIFLTTVLFFLPYLNSLIILGALVINAISHFLIDYSKIKYENKHKVNIIASFLLDQVFHIIAFSLISFYLPVIKPYYFTNQWWFEYYEQVNFLLYITGFIIFSYTWDIFVFIRQLHFNKTVKYSRSYYLMIIRIFVYAIIFSLLGILNKFYFNFI